jgi:addiction module HigA family antidote
MIKSFRHKGLKRFFETGSKAGIQAAHAAKLSRQLSRLNQAKAPGDMNIPGWKLHPLESGLAGPGETLREEVLPAMGLSVTEAAKQIGVTRATLSRVLNGRAAISIDMALRLEHWLGVEQGGRAELWLEEQLAYDLWQARQKIQAA